MIYKTRGVCAPQINLEIEDGVIRELSFMGGCNGNLKGLAALVTGQNAAEIAQKLKGTTCGTKTTSCPDQLSQAIEQTLTKKV